MHFARRIQVRATAVAILLITTLVSASSSLATSAPVAGGAIQERVYVNWGELEVSATDLDAGGRSGWNVLVSRVYRSRTLGATAFGMGWDSPILRRLRALPDGTVEYRDGLGDIWTFSVNASTGAYVSPAGLGLRLTRGESGWTLIDAKWRITRFDDYGRLTLEGDEFYQPYRNAGNRIAYLYGANGLLTTILDPFDRATTIAWWSDSDRGTAGASPGNIRSITDWRGRTVRYEYDPTKATLLRVVLPRMDASTPGEAVIRYAYSTSGSTYNDQLELHTNLISITDPGETAPRLEVEYATSGAERDRIVLQKWGTGETVRFEYPDPATVRITDALGQLREYTIANPPAVPRPQILALVERGIAVSRTPLGTLPDAPVVTAPQAVTQDRTFGYSYYPTGHIRSASLDGVRETRFDWKKPPQVADYVPTFITTTPAAPVAQRLAKTAPRSVEPLRIGFVWQGDGGGSSWSSMGAYLAGVTANGRKREIAEAHRDALAQATHNDEIEATDTRDSEGQLRNVSSTGGTDTGSNGSEATVDWYGADAPLHARGRMKGVTRGETTTRFEYPTANRIVVRDARGVRTATDTNDWGLPVHREISGAGLTTDESWRYDLAGRLVESRRKQGPLTVTTEIDHDLLGRPRSVTTDNVSIGGAMQSSTTRTEWKLAARQIVTTLPSGATITRHLDGLGRTEREVVYAGPTGSIETRFQYDLDDNVVFATNGVDASAAAFDVHGRPVARLAQDGTRSRIEWDAWGNPASATAEDSTGFELSRSTLDYTEAGRLREVIDRFGSESIARKTALVWDGAGRTTGTGVAPMLTGAAQKLATWDLDPSNERAYRRIFDASGRLVDSSFGRGSAGALEDVLGRTSLDAFAGYLPQRIASSDRAGALGEATAQYDTLGNPTVVASGSRTWLSTFDEASNLRSFESPGLGASTWNHDALGHPTSAAHPEQGDHTYGWDASGALSRYTDPSSEATRTESDLLGRPMQRVYPDGTVERIEYDGWRVRSVTDRQGRTQLFEYNAKGQLAAIVEQGSLPYDELEYDAAGRLVVWRNRDSELRWENLDGEGRPRRTVVRRYADGTGFTTKVLVDELVQEHDWNIHGERMRWTMPWYAGLAPTGAWTRELRAVRDAAGNLAGLDRTLTTGATETLLSSDYRGAGRPKTRTIMTHCAAASCTPAILTRSYGYDAPTGSLQRMEVTANGLTVAGSRVAAFDGLRLGRLELFGYGAAREALFSYDRRGRLRQATPDARAGTVRTVESLTPADFRDATARDALLSDAQKATLAERGVRAPAVTGRSAAFGELPGHRVGTIDENGTVRAVAYDGALRRDDDRFLYEFDEKERLVRLTEKPRNPGPLTVRRVLYDYDGNDRLIGRRAEYAPLAAVGVMPEERDWKREDRGDILASDGLPAEVTFAWDPVSDTIAAVFKAGASRAGASPDADGGLVRQIIHGELGYDDPIEVAVAGSFGASAAAASSAAVIPSAARNLPNTPSPVQTPSPGPARLYPIFDEAGTGSLQAIVNETGDVVARWGAAGAYGEDDFVVAGPAVEKIARRAKTKDDGTLAWIEVSVGLTEALDEASIAGGARLAVTDAAGVVIREAGAPRPAVDEPGRLVWRMTPEAWQSLVAPAPDGTAPAILSIAVTGELRAAAWGDAAIAPPPEWAALLYPVRSTDELPVEYRETLASLASWLASLPPTAEHTERLYAIDALGGFGTPRDGAPTLDDPVRLLVLAPFHGHPWQEPLSGQNYVRNRWFDPNTGTWLTPDPLGYQDSSNLYAFCGGDPVNGRDPTGQLGQYDKEALLNEANNLVKNLAVGARDRVIQYANLIYYFGIPEVQAGIQDEIKETVEAAQDPGLGSSPDQRLLNRKGAQIRKGLIEFANSPKDVQQQKIAATGIDVVAALAPGAEGFVPARTSIKLAPELVSVAETQAPFAFRRLSIREVHDIGVERGRAQAAAHELTRVDWANPFGSRGGFGQGIDDIYRAPDGSWVIVEHKGGTAGLAPGQMSEAWALRKIDELIEAGDPIGLDLARAYRRGELSGITYKTNIVDGVVQPTRTYRMDFYGAEH